MIDSFNYLYDVLIYIFLKGILFIKKVIYF